MRRNPLYLRLGVALAFALLSSLAAAHADTLAENTSAGSGLNPGFYGVGFTVAGTGAFDNIAFSFGPNAYAVGTGYIFSAPYTGTPNGLATAGYLGFAPSSGPDYIFASSLDLIGGQTYYFYEDGVAPGFSSATGTPAGMSFYFANNFYNSFANSNGDPVANFIVTGNPVASATPEPSSIALLGTSLLGFAGILRRRLV